MSGRNEPRQGPGNQSRGHAAAWVDQAAVDLDLSSSARSASVESLPDARARKAYGNWLERCRQFKELQVSFDASAGVLWCHMNPIGRPSVTSGLVEGGRGLQSSVKRIFEELSSSGQSPVRYMVWDSKIPGVFNLGGDLRLFSRLIREGDQAGLLAYATACVDVVYNNIVGLGLPILTISLVEGDALGGGFEKALSTNVLIAERGTRFGLPEVLFGLFPGMGAYSLISRRIGSAQAKRMVLSGRVYCAEELYELGLVDVLSEPGEGRQTVDDFIARNTRHHAAQCAVFRADQRVNPLAYEELYDIALIWVETALSLVEPDLRKMERLAAAQDRRRAAARPQSRTNGP
jgi:DSF synthase